MRKITLDAETRSKLSPGAEEIEICDERGTTLGYFVPPDEYRERFYAWAISLFDDDEIDRTPPGPGDMTTQEAIEYLAQRFPQIRAAGEVRHEAGLHGDLETFPA